MRYFFYVFVLLLCQSDSALAQENFQSLLCSHKAQFPDAFHLVVDDGDQVNVLSIPVDPATKNDIQSYTKIEALLQPIQYEIGNLEFKEKSKGLTEEEKNQLDALKKKEKKLNLQKYGLAFEKKNLFDLMIVDADEKEKIESRVDKVRVEKTLKIGKLSDMRIEYGENIPDDKIDVFAALNDQLKFLENEENQLIESLLMYRLPGQSFANSIASPDTLDFQVENMNMSGSQYVEGINGYSEISDSENGIYTGWTFWFLATDSRWFCPASNLSMIWTLPGTVMYALYSTSSNSKPKPFNLTACP